MSIRETMEERGGVKRSGEREEEKKRWKRRATERKKEGGSIRIYLALLFMQTCM